MSLVRERTHIFICTNRKAQGKCCALYDSEKIFEYFKAELNRKYDLLDKTKRIKVVKTSCLGQCAFGPNIFIVPDNIWYRFSTLSDIDELIDTHLIQGKLVERLINTGIHHDNTIQPA
ncbi:MAG: ferredoxin 2fe-2s protein [uncultured bacterium]|nr:MAG: ferredoxin 2fe-2s protein [uncultured bacterium]